MHRIVALTFVVILGLIVGCNSQGPKVAKRDAAVLDVAPPAGNDIPAAEPMLASAPINDTPAFAAVQPAAAQPVAYHPAQQAAPMTAVPPAPSPAKTYTVRKGDTLFSIAKTQLGNGRDWQKIAAANPGLTPAKLRAGQQIAMP